MSNLNSMSAAVKVVIDGYEPGHEFYGNELKNNELAKMPAALNWQGWTEKQHISKVGFFNKEEPAVFCTSRCEQCGFYYLNNQGEPLKKTDTPLCGVW